MPKNASKSLLASLVLPALRQFGYELRSTKGPQVTVGAILTEAFASRSDTTFVQVGAHDGQANDPVNELRRSNGWQGLMVEANPRIYPRLVESLLDSPNVKAINAALSKTAGSVIFYRIANPSQTKQPFWAEQVSSLSRSHVVQTLKGWGYVDSEIDALVEPINVPSITFTELLREHSISQVDLLLLDTEGMDFQLLSSFPFDAVQPDWIVFESVHLNREERKEIPAFLQKHGYCFFEFGIDIVCRKWQS